MPTVKRAFPLRRPVGFSLFVTGAILAIALAIGTVAHFAAPDLPWMWLGMGVNVGLAVLSVVLLTVLGWWRRIGFTPPREWRNTSLLLPLIAVVIVAAIADGNWSIGLGTALVALALTLVIGFAEETLFRGVILEALRARSVVAAVVGSSLLFAATHALNAIGADPIKVTVQIATALGVGVAFAAVRIRTGTIVPLILVHAAINFVGFTSTNGYGVATAVDPAQVPVDLAIAAAFGLYGIAILVRQPRRPVTVAHA